ncbi:MAG: uL15m family ribosomal protein [Candidatus Thermoplasmatota archaeon]|nr:uL15m family ribosomal protein [Candidatus Thermoplasmatota archaeon]
MVSRTKKFRGSRTHGRGQKGGRGKGKRGGCGMAGTHKHKYTWVLKYHPDYFGRRGFKRPQKVIKEKRTINLREISEENLAVKEEEGKLILDLKELGYDKLLGKGALNKPLTIIVPSASKQAVEKVKSAGGEVKTD